MAMDSLAETPLDDATANTAYLNATERGHWQAALLAQLRNLQFQINDLIERVETLENPE